MNLVLYKLLILVVLCEAAIAADVITGTVYFTVFNRQEKNWVKLTDNNSDFEANGCSPKEPFAIIVHGWREGSYTEWITDMKSNMTTYRSGCVMFMSYANDNRNIDYFGELLPYFSYLANNLTDHLRRLESMGFDPAAGFIFGFSFGAQLAFEAGRRFGFKKLARIDACEPAGPGFDGDSDYSLLDPKQAAKGVQCIHTSSNLGTHRRSCQTNWNMGKCGKEQVAAGPFPKGSHGLCPFFYNSAFTHNFYAVPMPKGCTSSRYTGCWPRGYKMGYFSDMNSDIQGEFFSPTTKFYPYNDDTVLNEI
ncbi:pancreatic triacylglycerol lipase-like [Topomyia yanbarensis]|uniref:pancreatic triacylglycerol lipase-like n=1 Tax=Topomyia yanbarensis TaxID=2498891 RepID=UPI00273C06E3|nr:pancreatic triacylglycerol lipase-like [Topomyia yanbarensis]